MKTVFIPAKLDVNHLVNENPPKIKNFKKDNLLKILGLISELPLQKKNLRTREGFTLVHSKYFQSIVHNYVEYIDWKKRTT